MGEETGSTFLRGLKGGRGQDGPHPRAVLEIPHPRRTVCAEDFCLILYSACSKTQSSPVIKKKKTKLPGEKKIINLAVLNFHQCYIREHISDWTVIHQYPGGPLSTSAGVSSRQSALQLPTQSSPIAPSWHGVPQSSTLKLFSHRMPLTSHCRESQYGKQMIVDVVMYQSF